ncbi:MAG: HAD family hydrolase [Coriobacteriia bacterium]|nr:HAD family hydrolase [Coriobacteriia bacterium]
MNRKYFFFDYDGTLAVPRTTTIPQSTRDAVAQLREAGHFVALATGRMQCNVADFVENTKISNIVADGGWSVTLDGELKWIEPLELEPVKDCLRKLDAAGIPWAVTVENEMLRYAPDQRFVDVAQDYYVPTQVDPELTIDGLTRVHKVYIPSKQGPEQQALIESGMLDGVTWAYYDSDNIFVEPTDKARGIRKTMELIGAADSLADVVVFGDGKNDLGMFLPEWTSIAMGNAIPELKERATYVTTDCDDDGIANACRHFGWIK